MYKTTKIYKMPSFLTGYLGEFEFLNNPIDSIKKALEKDIASKMGKWEFSDVTFNTDTREMDIYLKYSPPINHIEVKLIVA